ncbi:pre-mRNA processing RNA-helicase [Phlyctochytrium bullatum]|nr:pre-mRNA processing RNA-helicase [Phlyctochytrium bullatum]
MDLWRILEDLGGPSGPGAPSIATTPDAGKALSEELERAVVTLRRGGTSASALGLTAAADPYAALLTHNETTASMTANDELSRLVRAAAAAEGGGKTADDLFHVLGGATDHPAAGDFATFLRCSTSREGDEQGALGGQGSGGGDNGLSIDHEAIARFLETPGLTVADTAHAASAAVAQLGVHGGSACLDTGASLSVGTSAGAGSSLRQLPNTDLYGNDIWSAIFQPFQEPTPFKNVHRSAQDSLDSSNSGQSSLFDPQLFAEERFQAWSEGSTQHDNPLLAINSKAATACGLPTATLHTPKRRFYVNDFVAVRGQDGREYYGQIQSFISCSPDATRSLAFLDEGLQEQEDDEAADERYFCMRWLVPDKVKFQQALLEGRDFLPSDFYDAISTQSQVTAESLSSINRVFYSPKLVEMATMNISPDISSSGDTAPTFGDHFSEGQNIKAQLSGEMEILWAMAVSPMISLKDLICTVALHQSSHAQLFESIYGQDFTKWLAWMLGKDRDMFLRYAKKLAVIELQSTAAIATTHASDKPTESTRKLRAMILELFVKHFLLPDDLPFRVAMFIKSAIGLVRFLRPDRFGWCKLPTNHTEASRYPFGIRRMVRLAHIMPGEMGTLNNSNPPSEHEAIRLLQHMSTLIDNMASDPIFETSSKRDSQKLEPKSLLKAAKRRRTRSTAPNTASETEVTVREAGTETETETENGIESGTGTETGKETETGTETGTVNETGTETGAETETETIVTPTTAKGGTAGTEGIGETGSESGLRERSRDRERRKLEDRERDHRSSRSSKDDDKERRERRKSIKTEDDDGSRQKPYASNAEPETELHGDGVRDIGLTEAKPLKTASSDRADDDMQIDTPADNADEERLPNDSATHENDDMAMSEEEDGSPSKPSLVNMKPNQDSIRSVMESLSVEEKTKQRRERVEKWRKEKLAKEHAELAALGLPIPAVEENEAVEEEKAEPETKVEKKRKAWSLEDEDDDEEVETGTIPSVVSAAAAAGLATAPIRAPVVNFDVAEDESNEKLLAKRKKKLSLLKETVKEEEKKPSSTEKAADDNDEEDALDVFMEEVTTEVKKLHEEDVKLLANAEVDRLEAEEVLGEARVGGEDDELSDDDEDIMEAAAKKLAAKRKDLAVVDHSTLTYEAFRKDFYVEPPEIAALTSAEVDIRRAELGGIKIRGVNCPKPISKWSQMGLPPQVFDVVRKVLKYEKPTAIQAQSIPAIMSGRDCIGIAKTGSGKTIAFLLPMFRHIKDQRPVELGEGPIALIMTPTRELAVQIYRDAKPFMKMLNLRGVCCYGGSPIKDQIAELKRGAEVIICTPGRMIDLLCANSGRVTNLKRVTYLVLDEADRMFDMGFEPQVMKMVANIRPNRQTILFSATFPKKMEALARKILKQPLEITVGSRSVVCPDVHQVVEVLDEEAKFIRLLEIMGLAMAADQDAKVLIFVERQEAADHLLRDLLRRGYPCQTLHGGKDQADRDSTISDFKSGMVNVVIATSVAARGLDVKQLKVVVNYDVPNHMEDYVHRCGRTGRAGNKGTAYTFITPDQERFSVDIVQALKMSKAEIPEPLQKLADGFIAKVKDGKANYSSSGFGGKGLDKLEKEREVIKKIQKKSLGGEFAEEDAEIYFTDDDDEEVEGFEFKVNTVKGAAPVDKEREKKVIEAAEQLKKMAEEAAASGTVKEDELKRVQDAIAKANASVGIQGLSKAKDVIARINQRTKKEGMRSAGDSPFAYEFEINDFPQKARWKVTNKEQITQITEMSGAAITTRGTFFPAGKQPAAGERKLFLFIEGETQLAVDIAKREIKRILKEETMMAIESGALNTTRYLVTN